MEAIKRTKKVNNSDWYHYLWYMESRCKTRTNFIHLLNFIGIAKMLNNVEIFTFLT